MDLAYDHIASQSLPQDEEGKDHSTDAGPSSPNNTLNADFQAAYTALSASASPWASRIGGFFGNVVKQGESVYREAQQEVTALGQDASKGLTGLRDTLTSRTRGLSLATITAAATPGNNTSTDTAGETTPTAESSASATRGINAAGEDEATVLTRIKGEAAKRLRDLQRAEDAADEALIKFGTGLRDFLKEAITIAPPTASTSSASGSSGAAGAAGAATGNGGTVLFESKDAQGKRVIHTSRFDAQLHVIHTSSDSFSKDPSANEEFAGWSSTFSIDAKTEDIAADLNKYPDLRATMEKLVPATIPYADFWKRYYFLRHGIETAEARRRDLLKAAAAGGLLKPTASPRKSDEKSVADSEASYDVVGTKSGAPSQAPNSPQRVGEDSEEEDWE
ncbi:bsd domain containing protein [Ophiostoma piceae UAMH 11346]|uniref:Bsd domain containing protein n=1 Tax=Ophiostoma piceae (strain UAMH 11346) TaxID=1262450 RepID=S3CBV1_OPHP1|nr:bsd domain containing protein [Ophiostoma piceae UAMH 11346]